MLCLSFDHHVVVAFLNVFHHVVVAFLNVFHGENLFSNSSHPIT